MPKNTLKKAKNDKLVSLLHFMLKPIRLELFFAEDKKRHINIAHFMNPLRTSRRDFLGKSFVAGVGIAAGLRAASFGGVAKAASTYDPSTITATVGITKGPDRADNAFRSLQLFKKQVAEAIGDKRVVIKVNFVALPSSGYDTAYTRPEHVEGILEFLKSIGKRDVVIAESPAGGNTIAGYEQCGYWPLTKKYPVKLMDLNQEGFVNGQIWQYGSASNPTQKTIRLCKMYFNPNNYIISATPLKTHNTVLVTLSAKNIGMSVPLIDYGWGSPFSQKGPWGSMTPKYWMHGYAGGTSYPPGDYQALNDNVYRMLGIYNIRPHLAVLDGYQGTEKEGPHQGTFISDPQKLAIVSKDWLAADRIGLTLMGTNVYVVLNHTQDGHEMPYPAVLNYCWQAGLGEWDDRKIQVIGDIGNMTGFELKGNSNVRQYVAHSTQSSQLNMRATPREGTLVNPIT
jgi:uncharacterized protein (DUF362 family)